MAQRKLLLADDSITIQKVVNLTFADEGIEVITVGDGDSAMEKMAEVAPDLVLADVNMPGLNGYQVCEKIKQSEAHQGTPVILLVGSFEPFDEAEAARVGADAFLTKPFQSIRQLVNKVTELLGSASDGNGEDAATIRNYAGSPEYVFPHAASSGAVAGSGGGAQYDNAGMDDEMIQTNNVSGFALDESSKFETRDDSETEASEAATTPPLSEYEQSGSAFGGSQANRNDDEDPVYEISDDQILSEPRAETTTQGIDMPETTTVLESDDDDLLELPFDEDDEEDWEEEDEGEGTVNADTAGQYEEAAQVTAVAPPIEAQQEMLAEAPTAEFVAEPEEASEESATPAIDEGAMISRGQAEFVSADAQGTGFAHAEETQSSAGAAEQFSPELIEAVANRVIEKLSDKAVREIAWEVVPQLADLIIKRMAEEKLKQ